MNLALHRVSLNSYIILIGLYLLLSSCTDPGASVKSTSNQNRSTTHKADINHPRDTLKSQVSTIRDNPLQPLFLEFSFDMTMHQYVQARVSLEKKGKLTQKEGHICYSFAESSDISDATINPVFNQNKLKALELRFAANIMCMPKRYENILDDARLNPHYGKGALCISEQVGNTLISLYSRKYGKPRKFENLPNQLFDKTSDLADASPKYNLLLGWESEEKIIIIFGNLRKELIYPELRKSDSYDIKSLKEIERTAKTGESFYEELSILYTYKSQYQDLITNLKNAKKREIEEQALKKKQILDDI